MASDMAAGSKKAKYLKRMRLPVVAASIAMCMILLLDVFISPPKTPVRSSKADLQRLAEEQQGVAGIKLGLQGEREGGMKRRRKRRGEEAEDDDDDDDEEKLLFSQSAWDNAADDDDWDSFFDSAAWSSLINEGFVGANVKDEFQLPRFKKPIGSGPVVPKAGALKPPVPIQPVVPEKVVISLGLRVVPPEVIDLSKRKKKKGKTGTAAAAIAQSEQIEKFPSPPASEEPKTYEWFDTSYQKSATYGKAKEFVEYEPLFGSCGPSIVATRDWSETLLTLGPFKYLGRSKNPCWYPDDPAGKFTCMPHFYLAGVAGPATDDVMKKILIHPDVIGITEHLHWWDIRRQAGTSWEDYCRKFQRQAEDIILDIYEHKASNKVIGDSSGTYFSSPTGWERLSGNENCQEPRITLSSHIRRLRMKGLVIVIMPHPTRRLFAEVRHRSKGKLNAQQFHADVVQAIKAYKDCFSLFNLRQCAYNVTLANSVKLSLHEGMYSVYMEDWIRIFPPEQFLVLRFEDYVSNIVPTLETIYNFLGIPEIVPTELAIAADTRTKAFRELVRMHNVNAGTSSSNILPETVHLLNDFYQPFLLRLGEIMGDSVKFTWRDT